ncbi:MAG TPA: glycerophosphodiester phosphodiesterase family protein [Reyranella sp.]|nr:glycerophosphodiester phosphodiesterase family protein [Reyranella sp.]
MTDIASHRGGALLWPENSRIAFENTAKLPVEQVEFDVHPTRDGKLVVIHDGTLDRTTDGSGPVSARDWTELSRLALKGTGGQRMLLLEEVVEIFRPTTILLRVEIKCDPDRVPYPGHAARVAKSLHGLGVLDRTVITIFQLDTVLEAVAAGRPALHVWLVTPQVQADLGLNRVVAVAKANGMPMLGLRQNMLDRQTVSTVRSADLGIGGWACNDAAAIARLLGLGVDVFTTDRPDLALAQRAALAVPQSDMAS